MPLISISWFSGRPLYIHDREIMTVCKLSLRFHVSKTQAVVLGSVFEYVIMSSAMLCWPSWKGLG